MRDISDMIAFLVIAHHAQSGGSIEGRFWQNTGEQQPNLIHRQSGRFVFELYSQPNQEVMSQRYEQHMVMPAQPTAGFIVIETDLAFAFFKDDFDGPTHAAYAHQVEQGAFSRGVAEVELEFRRVVHVAADHQPDFRARQAVSAFDHAQESEITDDGAFAAFFDGSPRPGLRGDLGCDGLDPDRCLVLVALTRPGGGA